MSIVHMQWAWNLPLPQGEKLLLLALADCAGDKGLCWPSVRHLSMKCQVSRSTIQKWIKALRGRGLVTVTARRTVLRGNAANMYALALSDSK